MSVIPPALDRPINGTWSLDGFVGDRVRAAVNDWLRPVPRGQPSLLQRFCDRDREPHEQLVPWAGEIVGQYLTASTLLWQLTRDARLRAATEELVRALLRRQDPDGYLGPQSRAERLARQAEGRATPRDVWGHYHLTGENRYRRAFRHFWWSILRSDRLNTGGVRLGEHAGPVCGTVAWLTLTVEMLRLTGEARVAEVVIVPSHVADLHRGRKPPPASRVPGLPGWDEGHSFQPCGDAAIAREECACRLSNHGSIGAP